MLAEAPMPSSILHSPALLKGYALAVTALVGPLAVAVLRQDERPRFEEIDVERINVVEPDGKLRLVISNRVRSPGPIYQGEPFGYEGGGRPGMIFFNDEETENGGLTFTGKKNADGTFSASGHLSFDQYNQDQVVYLQYMDQDGRRRMGLTVADRADVDIHDMVKERERINEMPAGAERDQALAQWQEPRDGVPLFAQRVFVGRDSSRTAMVQLSDPDGKPRLRLSVGPDGEPRLEFLDEDGEVILGLPE
jgi:hypothetical protein